MLISPSYYLIAENVFKKFHVKYLVNCYYVSKHFRYFARRRLTRLNKSECKCISRTYSLLTENFIKEFKDKVIWEHVSLFQVLTEPSIREFQDKVSWMYVYLFTTKFKREVYY